MSTMTHMMLIKEMTAPEIRVLQEFRRIGAETMPLSAIKTIRHPTGGGEGPTVSLVSKGFLSADGTGQAFTLTEKDRKSVV